MTRLRQARPRRSDGFTQVIHSWVHEFDFSARIPATSQLYQFDNREITIAFSVSLMDL